MDKLDERRQLSRVFGPHASLAEETERPDFTIQLPCGGRLGVEITSLYASSADAKLKLLDGYALALIDRKTAVHRSDAAHLSVDELTIMRPDGSVLDRVTGIMQELPSKADSFAMLAKAVADKEGKIEDYLGRCEDVDLIVVDGSYLFRHKTHEDFYRLFHHLVPRDCVAGSRFREIHLIATEGDQRLVQIPLIANLVFADCYALEHLLRPEIEGGRPGREVFQLLAAGLVELGHSRVKVASGPEGVGFLAGAWELFYAQDGKKLRSWLVPPDQHSGEPICEAISDASSEVLSLARDLAMQRSKWFSAIDLRPPAHETQSIA